MLLSQALASAASVGVTCGAGCGSVAFGFLSSYILSRGRGWSSAFRQTLSFFLGKKLALHIGKSGVDLSDERPAEHIDKVLAVALGLGKDVLYIFAPFLCRLALTPFYDPFNALDIVYFIIFSIVYFFSVFHL